METSIQPGPGPSPIDNSPAHDIAAASESRYRELFDVNPQPMWVFDTDTLRFLAVNDAAIALYGYSREGFLAMKITDVRPEKWREKVEEFVKGLPLGFNGPTQWTHYRKDGTAMDVEVQSNSLSFEGRPARAVYLTDVTERKRSEAAVLAREAQLSNAERVAHLGSWELDLINDKARWSDELYRIYCLQKTGNWESFTESLWDYDHPDDAEMVRDVIRRARDAHEPFVVDHRIVRGDGGVVWVRTQGEYVYDDTGKPVRVVGTVLDIHDRKVAENRLAHLAHHDALTDLPNRVLLADRLAQSVVHARRNQRFVAVLFVDLDDFKAINDTLGHEAGDTVLRTVADRLRRCVRPGDTVARPSGDEFVIVLEDLASADDSQPIAEEVFKAVAAPIAVDGTERSVSPCIGISLFPFDGDDAEALVRNADFAMYAAKAQGGSGLQYFAPHMHESAMRRRVLEADLRAAIGTRDIRVAFQPIIAAGTGRTLALEALVRWRQGGRTDVEPTEFVRIAEEHRLIRDLGNFVLRTACQSVLPWRNIVPDLRVAVNISPRQLSHPDFPADVRRALEETGCPPTALTLEITESAVIEDVDRTLNLLRYLNRMGITISIDDFGTGYSSLAYLKRFPIDVLKIDQSFVRDIDEKSPDLAIAKAIVALGRSLEARVVAEGVETVYQSRVLRELGCDALQGYFFCMPLPAREVERKLTAAYPVPD